MGKICDQEGTIEYSTARKAIKSKKTRHKWVNDETKHGVASASIIIFFASLALVRGGSLLLS